MHGLDPPKLAQGSVIWPPGHRSRAASFDKLPCRLGESDILTHNMDAKLADIAATAALDSEK